MSTYYITAAIPYVNAKPHVGHALEFVQADTIARYHRLIGDDVLFLSGGDENALKNVQASEKAGLPVQEFVDLNTRLFHEMAENFGVHFDIFQKGSDQIHHFKSSQDLWKRCLESEDIYKKSYEGLYCLGCELFYSPDELDENGECFEHPGKKLEVVSEENYFFRLSKYQEQLVGLISSDTLKITPEYRKNEVLSFLKQPLQDISISRSNERARNWGVPVPNDSTQRMYVWFDALNIYQSGIGFGWDQAMYGKWWPANLHVIGKGISRFHAIYWPAFLLSAKLKLPKAIFIHGYFTVNGKKMSKTVGNVVDPKDVISRYGVDFSRFYFLYEMPTFDDGDFSFQRADELYTAEFANGIGNLISRVASLCEKSQAVFAYQPNAIYPQVLDSLSRLELREGITFTWKKIWELNKHISDAKPWTLSQEELVAFLTPLVEQIRIISVSLSPYLPNLSKKLTTHFSNEKIEKIEPLFPRLAKTQ